MRHANIYKVAILHDQLIDAYCNARNRSNFPHGTASEIIKKLVPGTRILGRGYFKTAHLVYSRSRNLVLKTGSPRSITADIKAYNCLPKNIRNRYFAKVYWNSKYCLLQKYGKKIAVSDSELKRLKVVGKQHGLQDVSPKNIRSFDGLFKIVDANAITRK